MASGARRRHQCDQQETATRRPNHHQRPEQQLWRRAATLDSTGQIGDSNFAYRLIADRQDTDYWRNYGSTKRNMIAPSLSWSDGRDSLLLSYQYSDFSTRGTRHGVSTTASR
jgi:hypothetical protein